MEPDIGHPPRAEGAAGLGDLVLVVGKYEIDPAAVNVEHIATRVVAFEAAAERLEQCRHRHCRAFDVPARAPSAAIPLGLGQPGSFGFEGFHSTKSIGSRL